MPQKQRIGWLDTGRVLAIFLIVAFHLAYEFSLDNSIRMYGFFGASLFFIISGFSLAMNYPKLDWFSFDWLKKRYLKVAEVYYPAILLVYLLFSTQVTDAGFYSVLMHFVFLDWLSPATAYSIISPAWFIIPLAALYVLFPFLNRLVRDHPWTVIPAFLLAAGFRYYNGGLVDFNPVFFIGEFCFGIAMAHGKKGWATAGALISLFPTPFMIVPYVIFTLLEVLDVPAISALLKPLAANTFGIFLFHESIMKAALGKWSAFGLGAAPSAALAIGAFLLTSWFAGFVGTKDPKKKEG